jgi:hypothetical protein
VVLEQHSVQLVGEQVDVEVGAERALLAGGDGEPCDGGVEFLEPLDHALPNRPLRVVPLERARRENAAPG